MDSCDFTCELLPNTSFGLEDAQLWDINSTLESSLESGDSLEDLFTAISERLGEFNESTRTVINL